jgi:hypothetical protein
MEHLNFIRNMVDHILFTIFLYDNKAFMCNYIPIGAVGYSIDIFHETDYTVIYIL